MKIFSSSRLYFLNILIYGAVKLVCILFIFLCKVFHQVIIIFNDLILSSKLFLINKKKNKLVNKRKKTKFFELHQQFGNKMVYFESIKKIDSSFTYRLLNDFFRSFIFFLNLFDLNWKIQNPKKLNHV